MRDQDEIYEAATEEPATLGCPSLVPGKVVVHDEPGVDNDELQRKGEKLKACNDRSYAKMVRIAELANECVLKTTHAEYAPGQYGQDYREFGKTMCEIRELVGKSLSERFAQGDDGAMGTSRPTPDGRAACPHAAANKTVKQPVSWPEGYAIEMEKNGRKIVGVITESGMYLDDDTYPYRFGATVYDGEDILFSIDSCSRGISFQKNVLISAMHTAINILSHMRRYRANKKAKKGGAK